MDPNFQILLILMAVAVFVGMVVAVLLSKRVRRHGIVGALRRMLSGGANRSPYS